MDFGVTLSVQSFASWAGLGMLLNPQVIAFLATKCRIKVNNLCKEFSIVPGNSKHSINFIKMTEKITLSVLGNIHSMFKLHIIKTRVRILRILFSWCVAMNQTQPEEVYFSPGYIELKSLRLIEKCMKDKLTYGNFIIYNFPERWNFFHEFVKKTHNEWNVHW